MAPPWPGFILLDRLENVNISFDCYPVGLDSSLPRLRSSGTFQSMYFCDGWRSGDPTLHSFFDSTPTAFPSFFRFRIYYIHTRLHKCGSCNAEQRERKSRRQDDMFGKAKKETMMKTGTDPRARIDPLAA